VITELTIQTNIDLPALIAHYKAQLVQAECVLIEEGQNGSLAWITWTLKGDDELWRGFLFILQELDQEYYLNMRLKSDKGARQQL
jgi:hypothetical protein